LIDTYPNQPTTEAAKDELEKMGIKQPGADSTVISEITEVSVQAYPNPFNPETNISYVLPHESLVTIEV